MPYQVSFASKEEIMAHDSWPTSKEINFLTLLGTWRLTYPRDRIEMLTKYLESIKLREVWNDIDPVHVRGYALTLLNNERLMAGRK